MSPAGVEPAMNRISSVPCPVGTDSYKSQLPPVPFQCELKFHVTWRAAPNLIFWFASDATRRRPPFESCITALDCVKSG